MTPNKPSFYPLQALTVSDEDLAEASRGGVDFEIELIRNVLRRLRLLQADLNTPPDRSLTRSPSEASGSSSKDRSLSLSKRSSSKDRSLSLSKRNLSLSLAILRDSAFASLVLTQLLRTRQMLKAAGPTPTDVAEEFLAEARESMRQELDLAAVPELVEGPVPELVEGEPVEVPPGTS